VLPPRPNCAAPTHGFSGRNEPLPAATISVFTTPTIGVCNCLAGGEKWLSGGCEPNPARPRLLARVVARQGYCAVQQGNALAMTERPLTLDGRLEGTPPIGKELPMELTATVTAIMAIMSFGFLAAVILGMI
jgi:hypothetical protein